MAIFNSYVKLPEGIYIYTIYMNSAVSIAMFDRRMVGIDILAV
jgi:hypothetical protein